MRRYPQVMAKLLVLASILGVSTLAGADVSRIQPPPPPVKLSARVLPSKPQAWPLAPAPIDVDDVMGSRLSAPIRAEQEQILVSLVADTPDSEVEEKSDYLFRLAELYSMQQVQWKKQTTDPAAQNRAKQALLKAVKAWRALVENDRFRSFPKLDVALFDYAYTLQSGKYLKEARAVYDRLLQDFPNSVYVPAAQVAFADYFVEQGQLADAEARYRFALKYTSSPIVGYAHYKLGWIHVSLSKYTEALEAFLQAAQSTANDKRQQLVHRAALDAFVDTYAMVGKADKAMAAFMRIDKAKAGEMSARLAQRYLEHGKSDAAIFMAQEKVKAEPQSKDVCLWQYEVAHAMLSMPSATPADKVREIESLVSLYAASQAASTLPAAEAEECRANAMAMSGELARTWHGEYLKTLNSDTLGFAERLYKAYITGFPTAGDIDEMRAAHAEVLWTLAAQERKPRLKPERWTASAGEFLTVATSAKDAKRRSDAALAGMLAWKNALGGAPDVADLPAAATAKAQPAEIPATEQAALATLETFAAKQGDPAISVEASMLAASRYRAYAHHDRAIPLLARVVDTYPTSASAEHAATLLLDSLVRARQYDTVLQWVDRFANDASFMSGKPELARAIKFLRSRSLRRP